MLEEQPWQIAARKRVEGFHELNMKAQKGQICFAGSSLMEQFPIEEFVAELGEGAPIVYNRGVGGYKTTDMMKILDLCVLELEPKKLFINIGTNDLSDPDQSIEEIMERYDEIVTTIEEALPEIKIYFMAYYPINYEAAEDYMKPCLEIRTNERINEANRQVQLIAAKHNQVYIDVNDPLKDEQGRLKAEYTVEGMHIKPEAYRTIFDSVMEYVNE